MCAAILAAMLFLYEAKVFAQASIIFDPSKRVAPEDIYNLPVQLTETGKNLTDSYFQLPQEGDYIGTFTREVTVYEKNNTFSAVFAQSTTTSTADGEAFVEVFPPLVSLFKSALPQPTISNAVYLAGIDFLTPEDESIVSFEPAATFRLPLAEPQYGNEEITVYFYDPETNMYRKIEGGLSTDGKGFLFPVESTGIYAVFASAGELPDVDASEDDEVSATPEDDEQAETDDAPAADEDDEDNGDAEQDSEEVVDLPEPPAQSPTAAPIISASFRDLTNHWALPYISTLAANGLVAATPVYAPDKPATRAELAKLIAEYRFSDEEIDRCIETHIPSPYVPIFFIDVPQQSPYAKYICAIAVAKITTGLKDGSFAPDATLSRAEALKLLYSAQEENASPDVSPPPFEDVTVTDWFYAAVARAVAEGVADGFTIQSADDGLQILAERVNNNERSDNALIVQKILQSIGFYNGELDGVISAAVTQSILLYQLSKGIIKTPQDPTAGNIGPATIAALNAETVQENIKVRRLFRPHEMVTRAEVAKFAVLILGLEAQ